MIKPERLPPNRPGFLVSRQGLNSYGEYVRENAIAQYGSELGPVQSGVIIIQDDPWYGAVISMEERYLFGTYRMTQFENQCIGEIESEKVRIFNSFEQAKAFSKRLLDLKPMR